MKKWLDNYGKRENANEGHSSAPKEWIGEGYSNVGRSYSPAWGGQFQMGGNVYPVNYVPEAAVGGSLPGSVGFTYARTNSPAPSNGPYAKKTKASAQNGDTYSKNKEQVVDQLSNLPIYSPDQRYSEYQSNIQDWASNVRKTPVEVNYDSPAEGSSYYGHGAPFYDKTFPYQGSIQLDDRQFNNIQTPDRVIGHELRHAAFDRDKFIPEWYGDMLYNTARNPNEFEQGAHQNKLRERATMLVGARQNALDELGLPANAKIPEEGFNYWARQPLETALRTGRIPEQYNDVKETFQGARSASDVRNLMNFENIPKKEKGGWLNKYAENGMSYYQHGLDWKPKSMETGGWLDKYVPQAQTGFELATGIKPITSLTNSGESTSLGTKLDEAAIRQVSIDAQRRKQGQIRKAEPKRSATSKALAIAAHPMTALSYKVKGQDIPENFERGESNILENAVDVINPSTYLGAAARTAHNITSPKEMFYKTLNSVEGDDNMLGVIGDALMTAGIPELTRSGLNTIDKQFSKVGQALEDIRYKGEAAGLNPHEIASQQLKKVGITSNQRQAYIPGISDFAEKYIRPRNYMGAEEGQTKLLETINNIKKGGYHEPYSERQDAWNLYLGMPQKDKTFALSSTAPELHPSYPTGSLEGMDIYNIRSNRDYQLYPHYGSDDIPSDYLHNLENPITYHRDPGVMGGYNARMTKQGTEYNDIWNLEPNVTLKSLFPKKVVEHPSLDNIFYKKRIVNGVETGTPRGITIPVDKFIGKPFMSHGITPYNSYDYLGELSTQIEDKINKFRPSVNTSVNGPERMAKMQQDLENVKKYSPKYKKGGVIKDDRGQWAHPGEITEIGSNRITMQGVPYPVLGISDTGDQQMMYPGEEYKFKGKKVTEFPMAQDGKTLPPIYTEDPRKVKAYSDSLDVYNSTKGDIDRIKNMPAEDWWKYASEFYKSEKGKKGLAAYNSLTKYNKTSPKPERTVSLQYREGDEAREYKKPVQPYILKKEEEPTLKRKPVKMETIKSKSSTSTPGLRTISNTPIEQQAVPQRGEYRVSYYNPDMKDWSEQAFQTEEESNKFANEMSGRGYGGSYGNVTQTRKVSKKENGGWLSQYK